MRTFVTSIFLILDRFKCSIDLKIVLVKSIILLCHLHAYLVFLRDNLTLVPVGSELLDGLVLVEADQASPRIDETREPSRMLRFFLLLIDDFD